jgi:hypothetical protein
MDVEDLGVKEPGVNELSVQQPGMKEPGVREQGQSLAVRQPDRRTHPRYSVDEDSVVLFMGQGMPLPGCIVDLSMEGCRVRTREQLSARAQSRVEVCFKVNGVAFRFSGVVEWSDSRNLLGIRFVNMILRCRVALAAVIDEMEAAAAARAEAVNKLVAEQEAPAQAEREAKESAESLNREPAGMETKELPAEQPATTAAPAATGQQNPEDANPPDRRGQVRHEVDTSAKIFLVKIGSELRGRILDLSLSGCRICTDERFPVGVYTRVETEFRLDGLPFRLGGVIQAIHNRHTVGIRFLDLSDRKRQQVVNLIGEIQQMRVRQ